MPRLLKLSPQNLLPTNLALSQSFWRSRLSRGLSCATGLAYRYFLAFRFWKSLSRSPPQPRSRKTLFHSRNLVTSPPPTPLQALFSKQLGLLASLKKSRRVFRRTSCPSLKYKIRREFHDENQSI